MSIAHAMEDASAGDGGRGGRYYGFVYGKVTNVSDDQSLGRIKARIDGQGPNEESDWLLPFWPGAIESLPNKDDMVIIGFIDGDTSRGFWGLHPTSNSKNRPTEAMVLGTTWGGMYNDLATKVQSLITKYNAVVTDLGTLSTLLSTGLTVAAAKATGTFTPTAATDNDTIGKVKAADGSVVAAKSGDNVALSGKSKVR